MRFHFHLMSICTIRIISCRTASVGVPHSEIISSNIRICSGWRVSICARYSLSILFDDLKEFIETGFSLHGFQYSIFTHEHEISFSREFDDFFWTSTISDETTDSIREKEYFIDSDTSFVSAHSAGFTSFSFIEGISFSFCSNFRHTDIFEHPFDDIDFRFISVILFRTMRTESAYESLGDDDIET